MNDLTNLINALLNTILNFYHYSPPLFIIICGAIFYLYYRKKGDGDFRFGWKPLNRVAQLIESWSPPRSSCGHEEYKNSLYRYLRDKLDGPDVTKESGSRRGRIDIMVGEKVAIEIKVNLQRTTEFDRLVGQSKRYECDYMVIVLCGRSHDDQLVDMLEVETPKWVRIIEK